MTEWIHQMDVAAIAAVQSVGFAWFPVAWLASSVIGAMEYLVPTVIAALFVIGKRRVALEIGVIFAVSFLVAWALKVSIADPRPFLEYASVVPYVEETGFGMPSGHALFSMVVFGWLWLRHPKSWILTGGSIAIVILVGLSRVYLGVHYPSQVIGGWALGALLLWLFSWVDRHFFRPQGAYVRKG